MGIIVDMSKSHDILYLVSFFETIKGSSIALTKAFGSLKFSFPFTETDKSSFEEATNAIVDTFIENGFITTFVKKNEII